MDYSRASKAIRLLCESGLDSRELRTRVALLQATTGGDPTQSLLFRDLLKVHGIGDVASVVFPDQHGCWGFLELFRNNTSDSFNSAEAAFLADLVAPLTKALRQSQANCFTRVERKDRAPVGSVVLLLSPDLVVLGQTPDTPTFLRTLMPPTDSRAPIPAGAYNVAAQLLAIENGIDAHRRHYRGEFTRGTSRPVRSGIRVERSRERIVGAPRERERYQSTCQPTFLVATHSARPPQVHLFED